MFLKQVNQKRTAKNVLDFFRKDFDQLQYLGSAESLIRTSDPSRATHKGNGSNDSLNINQYTYKELYKLVLEAINKCPSPSNQLLNLKYVENLKAYNVANRLHVSSSTLKRYQNRSFVEFANNLFLLSSKIKPESPIDFRIYDD